jgi:SAM-dependent methyltransferase
MNADDVLFRVFPEARAGGFSRVDGTIAFYNRVNALVGPQSVVLDFGAGRGAGLVENRCEYRRSLIRLRGKVARVIGVDVDPAIFGNPGLDEAHRIEPGAALPLDDASVDLILPDYVFEHIAEPERCAAELDRVLRPGGWICARTPNRWNYVAIVARLVPEHLHEKILGRVQPERKREDVFPAFYRMNDLETLRRLFPAARYLDCSYCISAEPAYLPRRVWIWRLALFLERLLPDALQSNILFFAQKRPQHPR